MPKNPAVTAIDDVIVKHLPSWSAEFGTTTWCTCKDCQSVYSPAAYLVTMMNFLEKSPLDTLLLRRPDLATLRLTCANTNTEVPYIDLVTHVLESLANSLDQSTILEFDVGDATAEQLEAEPAMIDWSAYITPVAATQPRPDRAAYPNSLPFDAALSAARGYFAHLGVSRVELLTAFANHAATHALAAERLSMTARTFELITETTLAGAPAALASADERFGYTVEPPPTLALNSVGRGVRALKQKLNDPAGGGAGLALAANPDADHYDVAVQNAVAAYQVAHNLDATQVADPLTWLALSAAGPSLACTMLPAVRTLLDRARLSFAELDALLRTRFLNPRRDVFDVASRLHLPGQELITYIQNGMAAPTQGITDALTAAAVTEADFTGWAAAHLTGDSWDQFRRTLLLDTHGTTDQPDQATLQYWDTGVGDLTEDVWIRIDQLIRLWRTTGWTLDELDVALNAVQADELDAATINRLAEIAYMATTLNLPIHKTVLLRSDFDPTSPHSMYHYIFGKAQGAFAPDWQGRVLTNATINEQLSVLQSGLRINPRDLTRLLADLNLTDADEPLTLPILSRLARYVILAKALGVNVADLHSLLTLTGNTLDADPADPWPLLDFVAQAKSLLGFDLNAAQLGDLVTDLTTPGDDTRRDATLATLAEQLHVLAVDLSADNPVETPALLRRAAAILKIPDDLTDQAVRILSGDDRTAVTVTAGVDPDRDALAAWGTRVQYEPQRRLLTVAEALTDAESDDIKAIDGDPAWVAAVEQVRSTPRQALTKFLATLKDAKVSALPDADALLAAPLAGSTDPEQRGTDVAARVTRVLDAALPVALEAGQHSLIIRAMLTVVPDADQLTILLTRFRVHPPPPPPPDPQPVLPGGADSSRPLIDDLLTLATGTVTAAAQRAYELLKRIQTITDGFGLTGIDITTLASKVVVLHSDPTRLITYPELAKIVQYAQLRRQLPQQAARRLPELWSAPTAEDAAQALADIMAWPPEFVTDTATQVDVDDIRDPAQLARLMTAANLLNRLDVSAPIAASWVSAPLMNPADPDTSALAAIQRAVRSRYDDDSWLSIAKALNDPMRTSRRDALVDYLAARLVTLDTHDSAGLYNQLLIDVEMAPCMKSSPIRLAISTVQAFVQQVLLNRVPQVPPGLIDRKRWEIIQTQTIYMANCEVLYNPENYIVTELRDDKTPAFRELESALLSQDFDDDDVERAILDYLTKADTIAKLDVIAMHAQRGFDDEEHLQTVVHVVGRTPNQPHVFYYRRLEVTDAGAEGWTHWEQITTDVRGDLVTLISYDRRIYLFWALVTTGATEPKTGSNTPQPVGRSQKVQLCWSEYRNGIWGPKQTTDPDDLLDVGAVQEGREVTNRLTVQGTYAPKGNVERLEAWVEGDQLIVACFDQRGTVNWPAIEPNATHAAAGANWFSFSLKGCRGQLAPNVWNQQITEAGWFLTASDSKLSIKRIAGENDAPFAPQTVLGSVSQLRLGEQQWLHTGLDYFAISDYDRTYFGKVGYNPAQANIFEEIRQPALAFPTVQTTGGLGLKWHQAVAAPAGQSLIAEVKNAADIAVQPWISASSALTAATVTLHTGGAIPPDDGPPIADAIRQTSIDISLLPIGTVLTGLTAKLESFYDPFACTYLKRLQQYGIDGLFTLANQQLDEKPNFEAKYQPTFAVDEPYPTDTVDFGYIAKPGMYRANPCAVTHREVFIEIPMLLATRYRQNGRFEKALQCLKYVWDFTEPSGAYWRAEPLRTTPEQSVTAWLEALANGDQDVKRQIAQWRDHPFQPHLLARMRPAAYKRFVVMETLDTLLDWADSLYRIDTVESIGRATQLYVLCGQLSPIVEEVDCGDRREPMTFAQMRGQLDELNNIAAEFENQFPIINTATANGAGAQGIGLLGMSQARYFCLPPNNKLTGYAERVAQRLYNIRNCMNIEGVERQLPLFEKRIDPALLVRAAAQGLDLQSVIADAGVALPAHTFPMVLRTALETCNAAIAAASSMQAAFDRGDAEELAALNATHATAVLKDSLAIKDQQVQSAIASIDALTAARSVPAHRYTYFQTLMGADVSPPKPGESPTLLPYTHKPVSARGVWLLQEEDQELYAAQIARDRQVEAGSYALAASAMHYIPGLSVLIAPWGAGTSMSIPLGDSMGAALSAIAQHNSNRAAEQQYRSAQFGRMAHHRHSANEVVHGSNIAALEFVNIDKQCTTAQIQKQVLDLEHAQLQRELEQAEAVEEFLASKFTNAKLYAGWLQPKLSAICQQYFQLAYDWARQAERLYRYRFALTDEPPIIQPGLWNPSVKGLLAPEQLGLQLRRLEQAYYARETREFELTKTISLVQLAPLALIQLKLTGQCEIDIPEMLFDLDHPGHYQRRIKALTVTIPAVTGPDQSINATLTMLGNQIRVKPTLRPGQVYERVLDQPDDRFVDDYAALQQIVTSTGQDDSGLFALNLNDERRLPFDGAGVVGRIRIELDPDSNPSDWTDIKLRYRYTALPGGSVLRKKAKESCTRFLKGVTGDDGGNDGGYPLSRLFSMRYEFPTEWDHLRVNADAAGDHLVAIALTRNRFPALLGANSELTIGAIDVFGVPNAGQQPTATPTLASPQSAVQLNTRPNLVNLLHAQQPSLTDEVKVTVDPDQAQWTLSYPAQDAASLAQLHDVLLVCHYNARKA